MTEPWQCTCVKCNAERAPMEARLRRNQEVWTKFFEELDQQSDEEQN